MFSVLELLFYEATSRKIFISTCILTALNSKLNVIFLSNVSFVDAINLMNPGILEEASSHSIKQIILQYTCT